MNNSNVKNTQAKEFTEYEKREWMYKKNIEQYVNKASAYVLQDKVKLANDLLDELLAQKENFDISKLEVLNHTLYRVDHKAKVKKYIGEYKDLLKMAFEYASKGMRVLVIAPTGSGKAYNTNEVIKEFKMPILTVLPNTAIVEQQEEGYHIMSSYGKVKEDATKSLEYCLNNSNIVGATWNKVSDLYRNKNLLEANIAKLSQMILCIDEAHEQFSNGFRADRANDIYKISQSKIFKGIVSMTGTPNRLDFDNYDMIIEYEVEESIDYKVFVYDTVSNDFIINHINNVAKGRFAIFEDNINNLTYFHDKLECKTDVVYAANKEESQIYKNIMKRKTFGKYRGLLHTSTMVAGVDNKDKDVTDLYIIGVKDPAKIKQISARYREVTEINVHVFNTYNKKEYTFGYIESRIAKAIQDKTDEVMRRNLDIITQGIEYTIEENEYRYKDDDTIYFNPSIGQYEVNKVAVRTKIYDNYYEQRSRKQFEVLLREYFSNVTITNLNVEKDDKKDRVQFIEKMEAEAKAMIDRLEPNKDVLVLCNRICKGLKLTKDQEAYLEANKDKFNIDELRATYKTLQIDKYLDNLIFKTHNILYSDLVTDRHFDIAFAWSIASLTEKEIKELDNKIKILNYLYEREHNYDNMMIKAKMLIEHQRVEFILTLDLENVWLNKEHFNLILEQYKKHNPKDIGVKSMHLKSIIEGMYDIVRRTDCTQDGKFYGDLVPDFKNKKKITAYNCKEKTTLADIANQLNVDTDNKTLSDLIVGKKTL